MNEWINRVQSLLEYLLSLVFIIGGLSLIGEVPLQTSGLLVQIFGGYVAIYVYMVWFIFVGLALIYSKIRYRPKLHKNVLLVMYLTTIYTAILTTALMGFAWVMLIDDVVVGLSAAACWLRWKFKTEYLNIGQVYSKKLPFRIDS